MKKRAAASFLVLVTIISFTGCFYVKGFNISRIASECEGMNLQKIFKATDSDTLTLLLDDRDKPSAYYVCEDKESAQFAYDNYAVLQKGYPANLKVNKLVIAVTKEKHDKDTYISRALFIEFQDKNDAQTFFTKTAYGLDTDFRTEFGEKDGYNYGIGYYSDKKVTIKSGTYISGNSVLAIIGTQKPGNKEAFTANVFKRLGVVDPSKFSES